jgi:hypothetical protein
MGLLGSIGKFIFGGKKKSSKTTTSGTSNYDPWEVAIPSITSGLGATDALYGPGGAPAISPYEQHGYDLLNSTVNAGATALDPAIAENNRTLSGAYLDPASNPYIADIARRVSGLASANSNATFGGAGRTGSGLAGYYSGKGAADAANELYFNNYNAERGRMGSAVGMAPSLESGRYLGPQALISAGQNISSRPFDLNQQRMGILAQIGQLGQQGKTTGTSTGYGYSPGLLGQVVNSFTNKLFPGGSSGPW